MTQKEFLTKVFKKAFDETKELLNNENNEETEEAFIEAIVSKLTEKNVVFLPCKPNDVIHNTKNGVVQEEYVQELLVGRDNYLYIVTDKFTHPAEAMYSSLFPIKEAGQERLDNRKRYIRKNNYTFKP